MGSEFDAAYRQVGSVKYGPYWWPISACLQAAQPTPVWTINFKSAAPNKHWIIFIKIFVVLYFVKIAVR